MFSRAPAERPNLYYIVALQTTDHTAPSRRGSPDDVVFIRTDQAGILTQRRHYASTVAALLSKRFPRTRVFPLEGYYKMGIQEMEWPYDLSYDWVDFPEAAHTATYMDTLPGVERPIPHTVHLKNASPFVFAVSTNGYGEVLDFLQRTGIDFKIYPFLRHDIPPQAKGKDMVDPYENEIRFVLEKWQN